MGALTRVLWQCAADTEVIRSVGTATHVPDTGLDVRFRIQQCATGAPGRREKQLVTGGSLKEMRRGGQRYCMETCNNTTALIQWVEVKLTNSLHVSTTVVASTGSSSSSYGSSQSALGWWTLCLLPNSMALMMRSAYDCIHTISCQIYTLTIKWSLHGLLLVNVQYVFGYMVNKPINKITDWPSRMNSGTPLKSPQSPQVRLTYSGSSST